MSYTISSLNRMSCKLEVDQIKPSSLEMSQPQVSPFDIEQSVAFRHLQHDSQISDSLFLNQRNKAQNSQMISLEDVTEKSSVSISPKGKKIRKADGCRCKRNACGNQYCSCAKMGKKCGSSCECKECKNHSFIRLIRCKIEDFWQNSWAYKKIKRSLL